MSDFIIRGSPVNKLKVAELKEELGDRGLSKSGKKDELIARLVSYLEVNGLDEEKPTNSEEGSSDSKDDMMKKWQEEREQLLRENELRRQEEEAAASKLKEAEEAKEAEAAAAKAKEAEETAAKAQKAEEAAAKAKKAEEVAAKAKKAEEDEAAVKAKAAAKSKEAEERRQAEEKQKAEEQKKIEEEKKIKEQERLKAEEDKQKAAESNRLKKEQEKKAKEEKEAVEKRKQKEEEKKQLREAEERKAKELKESEEKSKEKEQKSQKVVSNGKEDESLILETAADDTLLMEIDQADIMTEEAEPAKEQEAKEAVKEPEIPTEAGQVKSLRRLGSKSGPGEERKRGWGTSKVTNGGSAPVTISSDSLKDIVPDMKPILENEAAIIENDEGETASVDSDPDVAGPKVPKSVKKDKDEPTIKKKRITLTEDENETEFLLITNLTRPFTVKAFQEMLKRTGTIEDFWIDRIKSTCCVQFSSKDQASETKMALNGVTWPVGNPKTLRVSFSTEEQMKKYKANPDGVNKPSVDRQGDRVKEGVREWDKEKLEREAERTRGREVREVKIRERSTERKRTPQPSAKSLEELFKKTTSSPAIYWKPLTEQQIQQRIELRNKKMMEAKIMREMEDTKETLQRSKKLISGSPP